MSLTSEFDSNFSNFLLAWVRHQELRRGASISELASSRFELDDLRFRVWASR